MISGRTRKLIHTRLAAERGRIEKTAPETIALAYPSPYAVGMSSLGYQRVYAAIQGLRGFCCERFFLSDDTDSTERPLSYEGLRELGSFPIVAFSVAYELELRGLVSMLEASSIPALRVERAAHHPFLLAGGPLTFSNPLPLAPFVDAIVMGEGEGLVERVLQTIAGAASREAALAALALVPHVFVPAVHGDALPSVAACDDALLPATSTILTPHTELSDMFLVEAERGCSRGCTYCVMRRSTNGGMRLVPPEIVLEAIPRHVQRVGLVGAAVSDHPKIASIVRSLATRGCHVGLSSLRPDRLKDDFVEALSLAGYRTLTTALDGASERLRDLIERRGREAHYVSAAELARKHRMDRVKLYLMLGLPGETDEDVDECARFVSELSRIIPIAIGVAPFCAKRNTPLDGVPYAGIAVVQRRLERLRRGLAGRADVRATSARWAWVEHVLSQGGAAEGLALREGLRAGGRFADFRRAFAALGHSPDGAGYESVATPISPERRKLRRLSLAARA